MASPIRWAWVWVNSRSLWQTGRPGVLRFMHGATKSWTQLCVWTELNEIIIYLNNKIEYSKIIFIKDVLNATKQVRFSVLIHYESNILEIFKAMLNEDMEFNPCRMNLLMPGYVLWNMNIFSLNYYRVKINLTN